MKLPLLVFSLIVGYLACISYAEEDTNSMKDVINSNEDYIFNYQDVPWERSLLRNKRSTEMEPANLMLKALGKGATGPTKMVLNMVGPVLNLCGFMTGVLAGTTKCPVVEFSFESLLNIVTQPIQTIQTMFCKIMSMVGAPGRAIISVGFAMFGKFVKSVFLPGLHKVLNLWKDSGMCPPSIYAMIVAFNTCYSMMKMMGFL